MKKSRIEWVIDSLKELGIEPPKELNTIITISSLYDHKPVLDFLSNKKVEDLLKIRPDVQSNLVKYVLAGELIERINRYKKESPELLNIIKSKGLLLETVFHLMEKGLNLLDKDSIYYSSFEKWYEILEDYDSSMVSRKEKEEEVQEIKKAISEALPRLYKFLESSGKINDFIGDVFDLESNGHPTFLSRRETWENEEENIIKSVADMVFGSENYVSDLNNKWKEYLEKDANNQN